MDIDPKHNNKSLTWQQKYLSWLTPTVWGWTLTLIVVLGIFFYFKLYPSAFNSITGHANNFGDFLAGTAGSLALVWLIVGYFLQRQELKQNTEALDGQTTELENQVKATNEMAGAMINLANSNIELVNFYRESEEQRKFELSAKVKPLFERHQTISGAGRETILKLKNNGHRVYNFKSHCDRSDVTCSISYLGSFNHGAEFRLSYLETTTFNWPIQFKLTYNDEYDRKFVEHYVVNEGNNFSKVKNREHISQDK